MMRPPRLAPRSVQHLLLARTRCTRSAATSTDFAQPDRTPPRSSTRPRPPSPPTADHHIRPLAQPRHSDLQRHLPGCSTGLRLLPALLAAVKRLDPAASTAPSSRLGNLLSAVQRARRRSGSLERCERDRSARNEGRASCCALPALPLLPRSLSLAHPFKRCRALGRPSGACLPLALEVDWEDRAGASAARAVSLDEPVEVRRPFSSFPPAARGTGPARADSSSLCSATSRYSQVCARRGVQSTLSSRAGGEGPGACAAFRLLLSLGASDFSVSRAPSSMQRCPSRAAHTGSSSSQRFERRRERCERERARAAGRSWSSSSLSPPRRDLHSFVRAKD